ncbi:hypothetical protein MMC07_000581 [Pseudocyphellaria aurata]|nr:hypothetical protein [Pseudocyphellaria aurata]
MDYSYFAAPQPYPFVGLPSKPEHPYTPQDDMSHDPIDTYNDHAFHAFDQPYQYPPNHLIAQPQSPAQSIHRPSVSNGLPRESSNPNEMSAELDMYDQAQGRSSDEDKDNLTPAQSRRKAQNRAAQRAFRERKERHVKDLEIKLNSLEAHSSTLLTDNERLKRELEKLATQNEILRATTTPLNLAHLNNPHSHSSHAPLQPESPIPGPQTYSPSAFHEALSGTHSSFMNKPISHRIHVSATTGERLLATGATWDIIQKHELFRKGMVDIGEVCDRLKDRAMCDGSGPAFAESEIQRAIEDSVAGAGDELI